MDINNFILGYVDFNQAFTDLILECDMYPETNKVHNSVIDFSVEEMYDMEIDYERCLIADGFIDLAWYCDEYEIEVTFDKNDGFVELDRKSVV